MNSRKLIVLVGPTAVGKTGLAIRLAEHFGTEIISADSRQVFRELEIGTAKPSTAELQRVRHHFISSREILEGYDAGTYAVEARRTIDSLFETHNEVILCGGSGLYVKAIIEGFDELPSVHAETRTRIVAEYELQGLGWLQQEVEMHDPDYFSVVDRKNPQRLMRALEVIRSTGRPFSGFHKKKRLQLPFDVTKIGLALERTMLYKRIDQRVDEMIGRGLFEEAKELFPQRDLAALQTVGYQEIFGFLQGNYDREEGVRLLKRNTRRYAKRQLTWFRKDKEIHWFDPSNWKDILAACESPKPVK